VSVVIPTLNAAPYMDRLVEILRQQTPRPPDEVLLVDSGSTDATLQQAENERDLRFIRIERFSHGSSRNRGAEAATGDIIILMSQDAVPADASWLEQLLAPFDDAKVAATFSRQIPRDDANPMEQYFLYTHFPPGQNLYMCKKQNEPFSFQRGIFFSNVSAAIRRRVLLEHPFDEQVIMSEDQQFARDVMEAGYSVVYTPESKVIHSHNYSLSTCFRRYFDSVYSLTRIFDDHTCGASISLGMKYIMGEAGFILRQYPWWFPYYILYNFAKSAGTLAAHWGSRMPRGWARRCSLHRYYWDEQ
jgi:rhamnosyltransferase